MNTMSKVYVQYGLDLADSQYVLAGIIIVVVVACIAQNIVHLVNGEQLSPGIRPARGDVCFIACLAGLIVVVSSMHENPSSVHDDGMHMLVTTEEVVAYWYMVAYCSVRICSTVLRATMNVVTTSHDASQPTEDTMGIEAPYINATKEVYYTTLQVYHELVCRTHAA
jgi:hypothetical protein